VSFRFQPAPDPRPGDVRVEQKPQRSDYREGGLRMKGYSSRISSRGR
jgi:hypothetical protein